jgi:prevent-host-death family protein
MMVIVTSQPAKDSQEWGVADAKARFSEVIERALSQGPQTITRKGRKTVIVVSADEWERRTARRGNLAEFFAESPLRGSGLRVERAQDGPRDVSL